MTAEVSTAQPDQVPRRSIVILSTTPPIPRDYGNRNRVFQTLSFFRRQGFAVSFLLYPFDREWASEIPQYYHQLVSIFDYFAVIPNSRPLHQPARGYHHEIDEWWDDNITQYLNWLFARQRFDAFLVNYTFLSKAFEYTPKHTVKILDTHDLFSDRREIFEKNGAKAEFFYTNEQQETIGFDRSDLILAIKQYEKHIIQTMTRKPAVCLPYWDDRPADRRSVVVPSDGYDHDRPLRLGFIGAQNSVNILNMRRFLETFASYVKLYDLPVEVMVAGNVCRGIDREYPFVRKMGFIDDIAAFYESVDAIVAPLEFSTGIKIKVGEALAREVPVLATRNAFDGFRPYHATQDLPSVTALCEAIVRIAYGEVTPAELATAARKAAATASRAQQQGLESLREQLVTAFRRILLVVDRPFWYRANFFDEMISQAIEFLAHIMPPIVCYLSDETIAPDNIHAKADYLRIAGGTGGTGALPTVLDRVVRDYNVTGAVVMATTATAEANIVQQLQSYRVPTWSLSMSPGGINTGVAFRAVSASRQAIELAPLRYAPGARQVDIGSRDHISLFISAAPDEWAALARGYVENIAADFDIPVHTLTVPPYHEFDGSFFSAALDTVAPRCVLILGEGFYPAFLLQLLAFYGGVSLVVHPDFICPEFIGSDGMPSLEGSLRAFFSGQHAARTRAGPDTGWSAVWDRLSEPAAAA
jgi:Glycosyl transferases group 1